MTGDYFNSDEYCKLERLVLREFFSSKAKKSIKEHGFRLCMKPSKGTDFSFHAPDCSTCDCMRSG